MTRGTGGWQLEGNVLKGSPFYAAGMTGGDILVRIDNIRLEAISDFERILRRFKPGDKVEVEFIRWGQHQVREVEIGEDPSLRTRMEP